MKPHNWMSLDEMSFHKAYFSVTLSLMNLCHHISATPQSSHGVLGSQHKAAWAVLCPSTV